MKTGSAKTFRTLLGEAKIEGVGDGGTWRVCVSSVRPEEGLEEIVLSVETVSGKPLEPPPFSFSVRAPIRAAAACWTPQHVHFEMPLPWTQAKIGANAARDLPLYANVGPDGAARLVLAVSETVRRVAIRGVVDEYGADEDLSVSFFTEPEDPVVRFSARIRLDVRVRPFCDALSEAARWIGSFAGEGDSTPSPRVPESATRPWYSTWYSYHHELSPGAVVAEAKAAKKLGMRGLLLDSGWDLRRPVRGVPAENPSKIGDWKPDPAKIPDMAALARAVRAEGLAFVLWFALPFVGEHSRAWKRFSGKMLWVRDWGGHKVGILDPRFPDVRRHLASLLARAVRDWELDGLKLDFIDSFELRTSAPAAAPGAEAAPNLPAAAPPGPGGTPDARREAASGGRDFASVPRAVVALMEETDRAVRAVKPDAMVEFRQGYVGPAVRRFCTVVRASDCPSCTATNRIKTVDLRLSSGDTAVHGDMLEWDVSGSAEDAALQLLATLFAVPQISMRIADLPPRHRAMLRFWLRFWNARRETILHAPFRPLHPEAAYPVVAAAGADETVTAVYQSGAVADVWQDSATAGFVANATASGLLTVRFDTAPSEIAVFDCTGKRVSVPFRPERPAAAGRGRRSAGPGFVADVPVPPSGLLVAKRGGRK